MSDIINSSPAIDVRKVLSGKDGALYDEDGNLLVSVESFQSKASITNQTYQPLGTAQERASMTSYRVTITMTEVVIEDGKFFRDIMEGLRTHRMPTYNLRGMIRSPYNDTEQQIVYRDCVPDGDIDIQNMQPGELYKRNWSWICNQPPEMQNTIAY